jgi:hypothetical protein
MKCSTSGTDSRPWRAYRRLPWAGLVVGLSLVLLGSRAEANIAIGPVTGAYFANTAPTCVFEPTAASAPAFTQKYTSLNFNPPTGLIPGASANPSTPVLTNITTNPDGSFARAVLAAGNGLQVGQGALQYFFASFTGKIIVDGSQRVTFDIYHNDGFLFGIKEGAYRVSPGGPALAGTSPIQGYPLMWSVIGALNPVKTPVVIQFEQAGDYDFEIDYVTCRSLMRTLTVFADQQALPFTFGTPTPTPIGTETETPTPTEEVSPNSTGSPDITGTPTDEASPNATGTTTGEPTVSTPTATAGTPVPTATSRPSATPTPTPTSTPPPDVALAVSNAQGRAGDTITVTVDLMPGPEQIRILRFVLDFPDLDFDSNDANGDGLPDAIVFNPNGDAALDNFGLTLFNTDAATNHMLNLEIDPIQDVPDNLPSGTLMAVSFQIPMATTGGDLSITPIDVRAYNQNNVEEPITSVVAGVVSAAPPFTRTPVPIPTAEILVHTKGGGCTVTGNGSSLTAPFFVLAALLIARRSSRRRAPGT